MLHLSRGKWDKIPQMVLVYTIHYMLERASLNVDLNNQGQKINEESQKRIQC